MKWRILGENGGGKRNNLGKALFSEYKASLLSALLHCTSCLMLSPLALSHMLIQPL
jgi:hypothetical protein